MKCLEVYTLQKALRFEKNSQWSFIFNLMDDTIILFMLFSENLES